MDSVPYHGKQVDKPPTKSSLKKDMLEYLRRHGVPCEEGMRKFTLFSLVAKIYPKEKVYHIDMLFAAHCHTVIRLPPYMCDLNPIELAWHRIKDYVRSHYTAGDMSLTRLQELVQEAIKGVTKEDWADYCRCVTNIENSCLEKDAVMEDVIDNFIISLGGTDISDGDRDSGTDTADVESFMSDFFPL
jgi:transposase